MADNTTSTPKAKMGWARILLFASLALNLLVVGLVAGAWLRHDRREMPEARQMPLRDLGYGPYGQALSKSHRHELEKALAGRSRDLRQNRDEVRAQFQTLLDALRTTPFDSETVLTVISNQQNKLFERQEIGRRLLIERIEAMTAEERSEFADRLEKTLRRGGGRP